MEAFGLEDVAQVLELALEKPALTSLEEEQNGMADQEEVEDD